MSPCDSRLARSSDPAPGEVADNRVIASRLVLPVQFSTADRVDAALLEAGVSLRSWQVCGAGALVLWVPALASAQVTPPPGPTSTDTPSIAVGATIFTDYTYTQAPQTHDADGNLINPSAFNLQRGYINIVGNLSHIVAFRITPEVVRDTDLTGPLGGALILRVKYAYAQFKLDDWLPKGSSATLGIQSTPLVDYEEAIYRYRFQGTTFTEREGFSSPADAGASFHLTFPSNYGDVHVGVFNGEGYTKPDPNDQKALETRGTLRPFAAAGPIMRGLRVTGFYVRDHYVKGAERTRAVGQVTFESTYLNCGFDAIDAKDQPSINATDIEAKGWSFWATPKSTIGWEGLLRYDHTKPDLRSPTQVRTRLIAGVAYWFPHQGSVSSALLFDYDGQTFNSFAPAQPAQRRIAVHALIDF